MITCYDIIKTLVRTEKGSLFEPQRKYFFHVNKISTKAQIKSAVEEIYKVKVQCVNTMLIPGKRKLVRQEIGYTSDWKKALVTLKEGEKIEVA